ncbi:nitroreductase family protein [Paenibacillus silvae]|uniref:nitroreductase family protein n=1 Tax=Paenibacillus silvae TaxID=1325358 RepID=UPI002004DE5C|nr:nitroreductase family protein [Paenibacillus silvae]MCK6073674.1 nitroreductase family protein [Paenibacillus silvae]MCK6148850.1 nitroreductase family protein [Paenibacillus silvae]MCK6267150.1 nitroreductase family protein [Paenibacillus silvae]
MSELDQLIKNRRSAVIFEEGIEISESELEDMFALNKFAPSAFNLQHTHYLVLTNADQKDKVYEASQQYKVKTASAVIVVLGDVNAHHHIRTINEGLLNLGALTPFQYEQESQSVTEFYETRGRFFQREDAIRNASLSAMQFMLIAQDRGWDTCPMIGFDAEELQRSLNIPDHYVPAMLITIGKKSEAKQRPRGYRKPIHEYVSFNKMNAE